MNKELIQRIAFGEAASYELDSIKLADVHAIKSDPELQQRRFIVEKAVSVDTGKRRVQGAVMSTETQDRMGDIIKLSGWELENFKANPQLLWVHNSHDLPLGTPTKVRRGRTSKGIAALMSDEEYHTAEENPHAELVFRLVAKGALPGRSVGFRGLDVKRPNSDEEREKLGLGRYGVIYAKSELLENSVVPIPANQLALQEKALGVAREVYDSGCDDIPREVVKSVFDSLAFTEQDAVRIARDIRRRSIVVPKLPEDFFDDVVKEIASDLGGGGEDQVDDEPETLPTAPDDLSDEFLAELEKAAITDLSSRQTLVGDMKSIASTAFRAACKLTMHPDRLRLNCIDHKGDVYMQDGENLVVRYNAPGSILARTLPGSDGGTFELNFDGDAVPFTLSFPGMHVENHLAKQSDEALAFWRDRLAAELAKPSRSGISKVMTFKDERGIYPRKLSFNEWSARELIDISHRISSEIDRQIKASGLTRADISDAPPADTTRALSEALESIARVNADAIAKMSEVVANIAGASEAMSDNVADALDQIKEHLTEATRAQGLESTSAASASGANTETDTDPDDAVRRLIEGFPFGDSDKADTE